MWELIVVHFRIKIKQTGIEVYIEPTKSIDLKVKPEGLSPSGQYEFNTFAVPAK